MHSNESACRKSGRLRLEQVNSIPVAPYQQGSLYSPSSVITEGRGKRHNTLSSPSAGINNSEVDQFSVVSEHAAVDGPGNTDGFPDLAN